MMLLSALFMCVEASAQEKNRGTWYVGIGGGWRSNHMSISDIDESYFPSSKNVNNGVFSIFVGGEFGKENQFGVRPQLSFLRRGGKLTDIGNATYYEEGIDNIFYRLSARYIDIRVPLQYIFCKASSTIRPYVFVAPVVGFTTGGNIKMQTTYVDDCYYEGYDVDISKANMSSVCFAGQLGAGVKFAIPVAGERCYVGLEASYEFGFTNTYGGKEKKGEAYDVANIFSRNNYQLNGKRRLSGFELQAVLSVPFSIFKRKTQEPTPIPETVVKEEPLEQPAVEEDKPCFSLDEIVDIMAKGQSVEGKTICAIDAINFDFSKSVIKSDSYDYLDNLAEILIRINKTVEVKGHTDNVGSEDFNMNLSKERAIAVVEYLVKKGVSRSKLRYSYYGESRPLVSNDTDEGRAINRRVEFSILNDF